MTKVTTLQKNQMVITEDDGTEIFQSYKSTIAVKKHDGSIELDEDTWDYSQTTGRYRNIFLNESKKDTEKKIASGEYTLCNLN